MVTREESWDCEGVEEIDGPPTDQDNSIKRLRHIVKSTLECKHADLRTLLLSALKAFAEEMFSAKLITKEVHSDPDFNKIMEEYTGEFGFLNDQKNLEDHCCKFLFVLEKLGGPIERAASSLEEEWIEKVSTALNIKLTLRFKSEQENNESYAQFMIRSITGHLIPVVARKPSHLYLSHNINKTLHKNPQLINELPLTRQLSSTSNANGGEQVLDNHDYTSYDVQSTTQNNVTSSWSVHNDNTTVTTEQFLTITGNNQNRVTDPSFMERGSPPDTFYIERHSDLLPCSPSPDLFRSGSIIPFIRSDTTETLSLTSNAHQLHSGFITRSSTTDTADTPSKIHPLDSSPKHILAPQPKATTPNKPLMFAAPSTVSTRYSQSPTVNSRPSIASHDELVPGLQSSSTVHNRVRSLSEDVRKMKDQLEALQVEVGSIQKGSCTSNERKIAELEIELKEKKAHLWEVKLILVVLFLTFIIFVLIFVVIK